MLSRGPAFVRERPSQPRYSTASTSRNSRIARSRVLQPVRRVRLPVATDELGWAVTAGGGLATEGAAGAVMVGAGGTSGASTAGAAAGGSAIGCAGDVGCATGGGVVGSTRVVVTEVLSRGSK